MERVESEFGLTCIEQNLRCDERMASACHTCSVLTRDAIVCDAIEADSLQYRRYMGHTIEINEERESEWWHAISHIRFVRGAFEKAEEKESFRCLFACIRSRKKNGEKVRASE